MVKKSFLSKIIILSVILQSCGMVQLCFETERNLKFALADTTQTAISVEDLKTILDSDTTHYKVLIFYSPCCGPCYSEMKLNYREAYSKRDSLTKFYFILNSYGGIKYNKQYLKDFGIVPDKYYYLHDTCNKYSWNNPKMFENISKVLFTNTEIVAEHNWIPKSLIISKNNKLKLNIVINKSTLEPIEYHATDLKAQMEISSLDYHLIDTTFYIPTDNKFCDESTNCKD